MTVSKPVSVRLIDVARAAGVSRVAAAFVLNGAGTASVRVSDKTRLRIETIARELNYRPNRAAQQLKGLPSGLIGVIFDSQWPTNLQRLSLLEKAGIASGFRFMVGQAHGEPRLLASYLDDFEQRGVQGVLCIVDLDRRHLDELRSLFRGRTNIVYHGRPLTDDGLCVRIDTADGIRQAVAHLVERGRRRVAMLMSHSADEFMSLRRDGYVAELTARGLPVDANLLWSAESDSGLPEPRILDQAIETLVHRHAADAIIAADDVWAVRLIQRLKAREIRVPDDVAVVGYDNLDLATVIEPALTTIDQRHEAYAEAAIDLFRRMFEGTVEEDQRLRVIKPRLVVREST